MTGELFASLYDCGCRENGGHYCRPLWVTEEEWEPSKSLANVLSLEGAHVSQENTL